MNNWKTQNKYEIIQVLSGRSNAYFVRKDKILVDTGKESVYRKLTNKIISLGLSVNKITHLILTHTHFDHCQSAKKIKDNSSCKIVVSHHAANCIKAGYTEILRGTSIITKSISALGKLIGKRKFGYQAFLPDILIHGNYELKNIINRLKIIETPDLSGDSISVLIDNEIAIVGLV